MCSEHNCLESTVRDKDELSESFTSFTSEGSSFFSEKLQDFETLEEDHQYYNHGYISKHESKERILICNIGFNMCLQLISFFLVMLHVTYNNTDTVPVTIPYQLSKILL